MKLPVTSYGESGTPVVVMHGLFGSGRNWMTAARRLADQHRVFAFDLRNHGTSPHTDTMSYPEMAEDVRETIESLGVGPVALVGHSMGGKTAMLTALQFPQVVERLAVVDAAPVAYPPAFVEYAQAMRNADLSSVQRRADVDAQLVAAVPNPGTRAFLLQNLILDSSGARWRPNLPVIEAALPAISGWPAVEGLTVRRPDAVHLRRQVRLRPAGPPRHHRGVLPPGPVRRSPRSRPLGPRRAPRRLPCRAGPVPALIWQTVPGNPLTAA